MTILYVRLKCRAGCLLASDDDSVITVVEVVVELVLLDDVQQVLHHITRKALQALLWRRRSELTHDDIFVLVLSSSVCFGASRI